MISATVNRVPDHTAAGVNRRIRQRTEENVARIAAQGQRAIDRRLRELDYEWDIERALETMASSLSLTGIALSVAVGRKWLLLPTFVNAFLLQHALDGWCPPLPVLRRLGFRTANEIDLERDALLVLRHQDETSEFSDATIRAYQTP